MSRFELENERERDEDEMKIKEQAGVETKGEGGEVDNLCRDMTGI